MIKRKPAKAKPDAYIDFSVEYNVNNFKFKVGNYVRVLKNKNIFSKAYIKKWTKKVLLIKNVKGTYQGTYVIKDLNGEAIVGTFYKEGLQKVIHFQIKTTGHFPKPYGSNRDIKIEINLSNYATSEVKKQKILIHQHLKK